MNPERQETLEIPKYHVSHETLRTDNGRTVMEESKERRTNLELDRISKSVDDYKKNVDKIKSELDNNTTLLTGFLDSLLGDEVFTTYKQILNSTKNSALVQFKKMNEMDQTDFTPEQKQRYETIRQELRNILTMNLEKTPMGIRWKNESLTDDVLIAMHLAVGASEGVFENAELVIKIAEGIVELIEIIIKLPVDEELRKKLCDKIGEGYKFIRKKGAEGIYKETEGMYKKFEQYLIDEFTKISRISDPKKAAEELGEFLLHDFFKAMGSVASSPEETVKNASVKSFLDENSEYKDILKDDIKGIVIHNIKNNSLYLGTSEGEIELIDKNKINVKHSTGPGDYQIVDISEELKKGPIDNEKLCNIIKITKSLGKQTRQRNIKYYSDKNKFVLEYKKGKFEIEKQGNKFFVKKFDKKGNELSKEYHDIYNEDIEYIFSLEENGKIRKQEKNKKNGKILFEDTYRMEKDPLRNNELLKNDGKPIMYNEDGTKITLYRDWNPESGEKTPEAYFDFLAKKLDTPYKLSKFIEGFFRYTRDPRLYFGTFRDKEVSKIPGEYYFSPKDLISRTQTHNGGERGYMLGDCDDYAGLLYEILKRQGKNVYYTIIPNHVILLGQDETKDGKKFVYTACTFGLDVNGKRNFSPNDTWENLMENYSVQNGKDGILKVFKKYGKPESVYNSAKLINPKFVKKSTGSSILAFEWLFGDKVKLSDVVTDEDEDKVENEYGDLID